MISSSTIEKVWWVWVSLLCWSCSKHLNGLFLFFVKNQVAQDLYMWFLFFVFFFINNAFAIASYAPQEREVLITCWLMSINRVCTCIYMYIYIYIWKKQDDGDVGWCYQGFYLVMWCLINKTRLWKRDRVVRISTFIIHQKTNEVVARLGYRTKWWLYLLSL